MIPAQGRWRQVTLSYEVNLRPVWSTQNPVSERERDRDRET